MLLYATPTVNPCVCHSRREGFPPTSMCRPLCPSLCSGQLFLLTSYPADNDTHFLIVKDFNFDPPTVNHSCTCYSPQPVGCRNFLELLLQTNFPEAHNITHNFKYSSLILMGECPLGVMVKAQRCGILVSEFELQSPYYVHFRTNTLGKGMNPLILPVMGWFVPLLLL